MSQNDGTHVPPEGFKATSLTEPSLRLVAYDSTTHASLELCDSDGGNPLQITNAGGALTFSGGSIPVLATGASNTVDDVITVLQTLGLVKQS